jgi:DNA-binding MarR family transcriptional regulator
VITQTSLAAYLTDVKPKLNQKQHEVYRAIEEYGPITNKQLAEVMNRPVNTITPRVLELRQKRHIVSCFIAEDGGRKAHYWGTPAHKNEFSSEWDDTRD